MSEMPIFQKIRPGRGRDFVVGDIHGSFDRLFLDLKALGFDPKQDRLFSVGDLVDRGTQSAIATDFLALDWVHAVRGNHEQMLLDLYAEGAPDEATVREFTEPWWWKMNETQRAAMLDAFAALPVALELETAKGRVGVLHAEVPFEMDWATFIRHLEAGDPDVIDSALWERGRFEHKDHSGVPGIDFVLVGHTTHFETEVRRGNCVYLDTGAVYGVQGRHPKGRFSIVQPISFFD